MKRPTRPNTSDVYYLSLTARGKGPGSIKSGPLFYGRGMALVQPSFSRKIVK